MNELAFLVLIIVQKLLKIINENVDNYNYKVSELLLEIENLKLKNSGQIVNNDNELLKELIQNNKFLTNKVCSLENSIQQILNKLNTQETNVVTGFNQQMPHLGPRLQKINPETLQLVKVYESVTEAMNEMLNLKKEIEKIKSKHSDIGALTSFVGYVRDLNNNKDVKYLNLEENSSLNYFFINKNENG